MPTLLMSDKPLRVFSREARLLPPSMVVSFHIYNVVLCARMCAYVLCPIQKMVISREMVRKLPLHKKNKTVATLVYIRSAVQSVFRTV